MPCRLYHRFFIEILDHICAPFYREDVPHEHVREMREDQHLFDICRTLTHDMTTLMHHDYPSSHSLGEK